MASIQQFLSQNFGHAGTLVLIFGSIYGTFVVCDNNLSPRAKQDYANILTTKKYEILIASLPSLLTTMFENFFGQRHLSWKCCRRSVYVSIIALVISLLPALLHSDHILWTAVVHNSCLTVPPPQGIPCGIWIEADEKIRAVAFGLLVTMPFIDYLNLWKTRGLISLFHYHKTSVIVIAVALVDLVIWYFVFTLLAMIFQVIPLPGPGDIQTSYFYRMSTEIEEWNIWGMAYPSAMFYYYPYANYFWIGMVPAVWLWLNVAAAAVTMVFAKSQRILGFWLYALDIENHPLRSVGFVAATSIAGLYGVAVSIAFLLSDT